MAIRLIMMWKYHCKSWPCSLVDGGGDDDANVHDATADEHEPQIVD